MAQKRRPQANRRGGGRVWSPPAAAETVEKVSTVVERKRPVRYGQPFVILEDTNKDTFEFKSGQWVAHGMTIAECRENCQVKELPQKVNGMTRYEIRSPMSADA